MPIYEYTCTACGQRTDILHGINDPAPNFCPECGAEGTLRKGFAPPAIVFKGSGWAKKDRASGPAAKAAPGDGPSDGVTSETGKPAGGPAGSPAGAEKGASADRTKAPGADKTGPPSGPGGSD